LSEATHGRYFITSDILKVSIFKTDQTLTKGLTRKFGWKAKFEGECSQVRKTDLTGQGKVKKQTEFNQSNFRKSLNKISKNLNVELQRLKNEIKTADQYRAENHTKRQEKNRERYLRKIESDSQNASVPIWKYNTPQGKMQIEYAKEMVEIAQKSNIAIVFVRPYSLNDSEIPRAQLDEYSNLIGAETIAIPYDVVKLTYPFYRDDAHPGPRTRTLQSLWLLQDYFDRMASLQFISSFN